MRVVGIAERSTKPLIAVKVSVAELVRSPLVEHGNEPNALRLADGTELARANVMGLVVDVSEGTPPSLVVDDGSERIVVRPFEQVPGLADVGLGKVVLIVGRPRAYGQDRFLVPECVRVLDDLTWIQVRKRELLSRATPPQSRPAVAAPAQTASSLIEEEVVVGSSHGQILGKIRALDTGSGADVEQVLATGCTQSDIERLLVRGEVFEISPGRLKVLE